MFKNRKDVILISKATLQFFKDQKTLSTDNIRINFLKHSASMLGIRISKKAVPLAYYRNHLRRKLREYFRAHNKQANPYAVLLTITNKIPAEKKDINDILLPEWISLLNKLD